VPRHCTYQVPLDSGFFTPLQLQPIAVGRIAFNAAARWLKENVCSHRRLIWQHKVGLVLWSWELDYRAPLHFHAADEARVDVTGRVRGPGTQFECEMTLSGPDGPSVEMRAVSVPLELSGDAALSGRPCPLPEEVLTRFCDDEIEPLPRRSGVARMQADIRREGTVLASTEELFRVHRHHCEVADQWFWPEALGYAAVGREELVMRHAATHAAVRAGLQNPVRRVEAICARTYQFRDLGRVSTTAYEWRERVFFVHELGLADSATENHAVAIEHF
jgi:acyl-CoA thioesterase FadM